MKKQIVMITLTAIGLMGQTAQQEKIQAELQAQAMSFQQATTMGGGQIRVMPLGGRGQLVTGSPLSAKEVNRTVQTLSDGTEIESTRTTMIYRDAQGRARTEPADGQGVVIQDPVAGVVIRLDPASRTAVRTVVGTAGGGTMLPGTSADFIKLKEAVDTKIRAEAGAAKTSSQANTEDLGFQIQNGVLAQGTRTSVTIPKGQIGNNRDIHIVNERWYSKDLQMIVKSINSDPRFGTTTYDLTNIVQSADPSLFQIPGNYTITEGAGRGGRGGAIAK